MPAVGGRIPAAGARLRQVEELPRDGDCDRRRRLSGDGRKTDGTGEPGKGRLGMAAQAKAPRETRPLGGTADETEEREIAAPQDPIADVEISRMTMGHDQEERTGGRAR